MKSHVENFNGFAKAYSVVLEKINLNWADASEKKIDQDGDGDTDFVDAKIAQYKKGGIPKDKAVKKAKMFAKKNNIKDDNAKPSNPIK